MYVCNIGFKLDYFLSRITQLLSMLQKTHSDIYNFYVKYNFHKTNREQYSFLLEDFSIIVYSLNFCKLFAPVNCFQYFAIFTYFNTWLVI